MSYILESKIFRVCINWLVCTRALYVCFIMIIEVIWKRSSTRYGNRFRLNYSLTCRCVRKVNARSSTWILHSRFIWNNFHLFAFCKLQFEIPFYYFRNFYGQIVIVDWLNRTIYSFLIKIFQKFLCAKKKFADLIFFFYCQVDWSVHQHYKIIWFSINSNLIKTIFQYISFSHHWWVNDLTIFD